MNYNEILEQIASEEKVSVKEIEREMQKAIDLAGLNCSAKQFIESTANLIRRKTIYRM